MEQRPAVVEGLRRLTAGERVIGASSASLLVSSLLPWYVFDLRAGLGSYSRNGWGEPNALYSSLAVLLGIVLGALVIAQGSESGRLREMASPFVWGAVYIVLGGAALALILLKGIANLSFDSTYGLYLGALSALGLVVGGYIHTRDTHP